ncbi:ATP-binding cassette sub-family G member 1-like [Prorops nasuta]|uniref:ATP-binding cassette sub-family G member 1-like n=1 Tax=Prorops nasuta TaxID=863751 RepID=UPI0034CFD710
MATAIDLYSKNQPRKLERAENFGWSSTLFLEKTVYLHFEDVSYSVRAGIIRKETKQLISKICGEFRPGELTAIMGPSGAGKSTFMDVMAGFTLPSKISGNIKVNGKKRDLATFKRSSAYIMQDSSNLAPHLTVEEAMLVSADLKLTVARSEKLQRIDEILTAMGLDSIRQSLTEELSGGQKKRLAVALELIDNPPIMFFDEPTSGLDSVSSKQCVKLLKDLASDGRTIICTIHQPSATLFNMIDHLYVLAGGSCVYAGSTCNLVPYLGSIGLKCPTHYNPADFLMEICNGDYGDHAPLMKSIIENGRNTAWRSNTAKIISIKGRQMVLIKNNAHPIRLKSFNETPAATEQYAAGFWTQLFVLFKRNSLTLTRYRLLMFARIFMHFAIALLVGILYFGIGQDAAFVLDNFNLLFFSAMFVMYSAFSSTIVTFPLELAVLRREHFNRWYKLRSFYLAKKLADIPVQFAAIFVYTLTMYYMSNQLLEIKRLMLYVLMCFVFSLVAQTIGLLVGTGLTVQNAVIMGPLAIMPFVIFSGFFVHINDAHPYMRWLFHTSFMKYGFEGMIMSIYGYDREKLHCSQVYCHFASPKILLKTVNMQEASYWYSLAILISLYIGLDLVTFAALKIRLKTRL